MSKVGRFGFNIFIGGHYVAYAKNEETNTWLEFNDSLVAPGE